MPTVPNLVGMTVADAASAVTSAGFTKGTLSGSDIRPHTELIIDQSPAAGTDAAAGSAIAATQAKATPDGMIWGS